MKTETFEYRGSTYRRSDGVWLDANFIKVNAVLSRELESQFGQSAVVSVKRKAKSGRSPAKPRRSGRFSGLQESDFQNGVSGTSWRRSTSLAGLLAQQLADRTGRAFLSHSVARRPQVLIGEPPRIEVKVVDDLNIRKAKFFFQLDDQQARYGLSVEKPEGPVDATWEWPAFVQALSDRTVTAAVDEAFQAHRLGWQVARYGEAYSRKPLGEIDVTEATNWPAVAEQLGNLDEGEWHDVRIYRNLPRDEAIAGRLKMVNWVVDVYQSLLSLYDASAA